MPEQQELPEDAFAATELMAGGSLIEQDIIVKANAGAMLTFAVWSLPADVVGALFRDAPHAFTAAYGNACDAYGVSERSRGPATHSLGVVGDKRAFEDAVLEAVGRLQKHGVL